MNTEIKDYLHLYIGCEVIYPDSNNKNIKATLTGFSILEGAETTYKRKRKECSGDYIGFKDGEERGHECYVENIKLLLRPLSDIKDEEKEYCYHRFSEYIAYDYTMDFLGMKAAVDHWIEKDGFDKLYCLPTQVKYLLAKHFDLFGLIEKGLAVDKTKYK